MGELIRFAFYPFLPGIRDAIAKDAPTPVELLESTIWSNSRKRALDRIRHTLGDGLIETGDIRSETDGLRELMALAVARMMIVVLKDRTLASRYSSKEAARVRRLLRTVPNNELATLISDAQIPIVSSSGGFYCRVPDYLKMAPPRTECKLVLRVVTRGQVQLEKEIVDVLVEEHYRRKLEGELFEELNKGPPQDLVAALDPMLAPIKLDLETARANWNTGELGPVQEGAFPPCINNLFHQMTENVVIPHHGRFAFASFLANVGMSADQILDYMTKIPNFDRRKSEYQIKHIAGEMGVDSYTPPGCATMQSQGICPLAMRDEICGQIKHPLSYYRKKKRRLPPPVEDKTKEAVNG